MSKHQPRIAVLAVHGVADQPPYSTQRMAASLLLGSQLDHDYSEFVEEDILVRQDNVELAKKIDIEKTSDACLGSLQTSVASRAGAYADGKVFYEDGQVTATAEIDSEAIEHESMREQLQSHKAKASASSLNTKVLMGKRRADDQLAVDCNIDVYELHWADLSRLKNGLFSAFFEFYLLLFFFSRIGSLAIERAKPHHPEHERLWERLLKTHLTAEFMLVVCIPVAHLCILSLAVCGAPFVLERWVDAELMSSDYLQTALTMALTILLLIGGFMLGRSLDNKLWSKIFLGIVSVMGCVAYLKLIPPPDMQTIVIMAWVLFAVVLLWLCKTYDKRRPGVFITALIMFAFTGIVFITMLLSDTAASSARAIALDSINSDDRINFQIAEINSSIDANSEIFLRGIVATLVTVVLTVFSIVFFVGSTLINTVIGFRIGATTSPDKKDAANRAIWTGALTLVLPGLAIILVTFSLWEIIYWLSAKALPADHVSTYVLRDILDLLVFPHIVVGFVVLGLATFFSLWVISPAPLSDMVEPNDEKNPAKPLGEILDLAFQKMRWAGEIFRWVLLIGMPLDWIYLVTTYPTVTELQRHLVFGLGIAMFTLLFSGKGPFEKITLGFRAGLDVGLDVTNWLRTLPRDSNARAGISRRYTSLLRHIATWEDRRDKQHYDAVVIACHSQGTVITADLLRFLNKEKNEHDSQQPDIALRRYYTDDNDEHLPVYLLTFGSPLRQLYHQRFPHQYAWAGCNTQYLEDCTYHGPDPRELNVAHWSNIYCSGDYVGRYLWYADDDDNRWSRSASTNTDKSTFYPNTRELCAGFGGHTKYWSGSIQPVGEELDRLIVKAAKNIHEKKNTL